MASSFLNVAVRFVELFVARGLGVEEVFSGFGGGQFLDSQIRSLKALYCPKPYHAAVRFSAENIQRCYHAKMEAQMIRQCLLNIEQ